MRVPLLIRSVPKLNGFNITIKNREGGEDPHVKAAKDAALVLMAKLES